MIDLSEIFLSIQGESTYAGLPCIFIRLAGCNLRCAYCDTKYGYEKSFSLGVEDIMERVRQYDPVKLVEITGGEPLLQEKIYDIFPLLHLEQYTILLETNGSLPLDNVPPYVTKIVDVKCPGSFEQESFLKSNIESLNSQDELKFVLTGELDYIFAKNFIKHNRLQEVIILFSPVTEKLSADVLADWILRDRLNVKLQLQLHKTIWGNELVDGIKP